MQKMTDEQRMRVVMCYPTATMRINVEDCDLINIGYVEDRLYLLGKSSKEAYDVHVSEVQLLLRPVSSLTDEECTEVARILCNSYIVASKKYIVERIKDRIMIRTGGMGIASIWFNGGIGWSDILKGTFSTTQKNVEAVDKLRSINIITTVHGFDLVAEGIAIVDDKIGEI